MNPTESSQVTTATDAASEQSTRPKRRRRLLKRAAVGILLVLIVGEVLVRLLGWDPAPVLTDKEVESLDRVRKHTKEYPAAEAKLEKAKTHLAQLEQAKATSKEIEEAKEARRKAEEDVAWYKAHWPSNKFIFKGYWPGVPVEFEQEIVLNDLWLRDYNYEPNKPAGVKRIVVLGDSYTTAWEVKFDEMFHKRLATELTKLAGPGRKVEVPAYSLPSMGVVDLKKRFLNQAMALNPDLLMLVLHGGLISENYRPLQNEIDVRFGRLAKYYVMNARRVEDRWTVLPFSALNRLIARGATLFYVTHLDWFEDLDGKHPIEPSVATYFEPVAPKWKEAWDNTLVALREFKETCNKAGIPLLVVLMPTEIAVNSIFAQAPKGFRIDWGKVDREFERMCKEVGADFLTMTPGFDAYRAKHGRDYRPTYDIHWNAKGHELAAQIILERLKTTYAGLLGLHGTATTSTQASK